MTSLDEREKELRRKEQEVELLKQELLLEKQALEAEKRQMQITQQESPLYPTKKYNAQQIQPLGRKLVQVGKFVVFVVVGIAMMRAGLFLGIWIARGAIAALIAFVGYKIFLEEKGD
ncbi:MAG: hypothetical protein DSM107014_06665 [Gomphosphaeria aponina SAG 52.96 = DSM 107014]|uniref:Uncharacterized protein n=1 Tax=Gomphosphaeria aponina SAG 52.96 = DSM 107014 TaxID=1521640 RepID=A0A941GUN8_9CHRO|nr:hypothetical protein [Gomphosphaeria aponina SAG 52.96 = DSM 107014]